MIRRGFAILLGVIAPLGLPGARAAERSSNYTWSCPQTVTGSAAPAVPVESVVRVRASIANPSNPERMIFDTSALRTLLAPYDPASPRFQAGGPDYHECVRAAVEGLQTRAERSCQEMLTASNWPTPANSSSGAVLEAANTRQARCLNEAASSVSELRMYAVELSAAAEARGALPAFIPMTPLDQLQGVGPASTRLARDEIRDRMGQSCDVRDTSGDAVRNARNTSVALTSDFVRDELPVIMGRAELSQSCKDRLMASYVRELAAAHPSPSACPSGPASTGRRARVPRNPCGPGAW